jgi:hypothetical protein
VKAILGDTVQFSYNAPGVHDKSPVIFFLAATPGKKGPLVHGLNQHYQSPQEKYYYFLMLKNLLYNKISNGTMDAQTFYRLYVKGRLVRDSYRTYHKKHMSGTAIVPNAWATMTAKKVDVKAIRDRGNYPVFKKNDKVRYVSMIKGKLSWTKGTIIGRKPPGAEYALKTSDGRIVSRHPADLRIDK